MKKRILVHCCCGPCATSSIKRLIDEDYEPVLCYGNSNIWPQEENQKRYENLKIVADYFGGLPIVRVPYDHEEWLSFIAGLENEPEHGKRCEKCFLFNLRQAQKAASELGIENFTTTLTVSRFKKSSTIFQVGSSLEGFEAIDFKKQDGFAKSVNMAKELGLYRQQYCGCEFSYNEAAKAAN